MKQVNILCCYQRILTPNMVKSAKYARKISMIIRDEITHDDQLIYPPCNLNIKGVSHSRPILRACNWTKWADFGAAHSSNKQPYNTVYSSQGPGIFSTNILDLKTVIYITNNSIDFVITHV